MKKILSAFGTRPEAIKMAPVVLGISARDELVGEVCVTAQHRGMLDQVMDIFGLNSTYDLDLMRPGQDLFDITANVLIGMRTVLRDAQPDLVLVHGDTTTCFAAGLAAFYEGIKVGHVEAGLRTGNMSAPFPEEANRALVGRLASFHFAPTKTAESNLLSENICPNSIFVTGNTVMDALAIAREKCKSLSVPQLQKLLGYECFAQVTDINKRIVLITGHRRENFGQGFVDLCNAIKSLALTHEDWSFVYPVHLNPNVQRPVYEILGQQPNVHLIEPQEYLPFVWLMDNCDVILTDSGGVQEEGPSLGKPVLVMRDVTERPEAVEAGTVKLVGTETNSIINAVEEILLNNSVYEEMSKAINPYGDGQATPRIIKALVEGVFNET